VDLVVSVDVFVPQGDVVAAVTVEVSL